jgi:hypothetical protein
MVRKLCAGSLLFLVMACSGDLSGLDREMGLVLETSVSSPSIEKGQIDTITVMLTNTTPSTVSLTFSSGCQIRVLITDAFGRIVVPPGGAWPCTQALTGRTLAPSEVQSVQFEWDGGADFSPYTQEGRLPHGLYRVFATLDAYEVSLATDRVPIRLR